MCIYTKVPQWIIIQNFHSFPEKALRRHSKPWWKEIFALRNHQTPVEKEAE